MKKILTLRSLGQFGRFGNQLFQVCTGLALARQLDAELQIPANWIGRKIFDIDIAPLDQTANVRTRLDYLPTAADLEQRRSIDLLGFWQFQDALDLYSREDALRWLPFQDWVIKHFALDGTTSGRSIEIAIHKRRGDYLSPTEIKRRCIISDRSFYRCLHEQVLPTFDVSQAVNVSELSEEKSITDKYCEALGIGFLPDFISLVKANIVIRSNSSFSYWAPILGKNQVYSPIVGDSVGWTDVLFTKGNHAKTFGSEELKQFRHTEMHLQERWSAVASAS